MAIEIVSENNLDYDEWAELTDDRFMVSPGFASVWRARGGEPVFFIERENNRIRAGISGVIFGTGPFRRYESMPEGLYGGQYFFKDCTDEDKRSFLDKFCNFLGSNKIVRALIHRPMHEIKSSIFRQKTCSTHEIHLDEGGYRPSDSKVRKHIRASKERGGRIERLDREEDIERFYELAVLTKKRHRQKPGHPREFFYKLFQLSKTDGRILWLKTMLDDIMIASQIIFVDRNEAFSWQLYADRQYSHYKPGFLMRDYALNLISEKGVRIFNMGSTPGESPSLIQYKESWDARKIDFLSYEYYSSIGKLLHRCRIL